ncbi:Anti-repressor SinI [Paenibacillus konkukensis]|uniref:Anti-repressor SinI n=1 Tax=Paenibacillus konkukensis TaxID=2020716 RepID=A0ABY4RUJ0_9BACL|nr:Anti-repressor SinI [Paenibacillus konkukensis]
MKTAKQLNFEELDAEWTELIVTARRLGLSTNEIREFLHNPMMSVIDAVAGTGRSPHHSALLNAAQ